MKKMAIIAMVISCGLLVYLVWPKTIDVDPTQYENKQELIWEDVLLHADLAVVGTVDSLAPSQWNVGEDGATLESMHTDATVRPAQAFLTYKPDEKQPPSLPEEITVRLDGGKIGWEKQTYRGEAVLEPGEDVLLLLHEKGGGSGAVYYTVYGGKWGKLTRQEKDGVVSYTNGRDEVAAEGMVETLQQITEDYANSYNGASDYYTAGEIKEMNDALFEAQYHDEYSPKRLVEQLRRYDPLTIYREGRSLGVNMAGYKKYMYQVYRMYNGNSRRYMLPLKF